MSGRTKVTAKARRSGDWWAIEVPEVPGVFTQVRRLEQAQEQVADAVATMLDIDPDSVDVELDAVLSAAVSAQLRALREANRAAAAAQAEASERMRNAVGELRGTGLPTRDVAALLGVSHQRVSQLEKS